MEKKNIRRVRQPSSKSGLFLKMMCFAILRLQHNQARKSENKLRKHACRPLIRKFSLA